MHFARRAGLDHQAGGGAQALAHQVLVDRRQRQQRRDRDLRRGSTRAVADDQDVVAALDRVDRFGAQRGQLGFDAFVAPGQRVGDVELVAA